jgi:hypothetical protein
MAVGLPAKTTYADGDVFSASDINDTNGTLNLVGQTQNFYAGKNKIINGDMGIWQRGTSITPASGYGYGADRWRTFSYGASTSTISQQTFTPGTAPVAGYEGTFFLRVNSTSAGTFLSQPIENVRTFAGQTVNVSFYAKVGTALSTVSLAFDQTFGAGGSSTVNTIIASSQSFTTSWARYSYSIAVPSISGKTIGTSSFLDFTITLGAINNALDIWGVQVEAGSTATAFQTATGTLQGELAACQRYFNRLIDKKVVYFGVGAATSATFAQFAIPYPRMRTTPALTVSAVTDFLMTIAAGSGAGAISAISLNSASNEQVCKLEVTCASGLVSGNATTLLSQNTNATFDLSAEL